MKVVALKTGYDGKRVRKEGDVFEWPKDTHPEWMKPVAGGKPAKGKAKDEEEEEQEGEGEGSEAGSAPALPLPTAPKAKKKGAAAKPAVQPKAK